MLEYELKHGFPMLALVKPNISSINKQVIPSFLTRKLQFYYYNKILKYDAFEIMALNTKDAS